MNQKQIIEVNSHKHLGFLSDDCSHDHLDYIKLKACNRINVMLKLNFKLDRRFLQNIYFTFIGPLLELFCGYVCTDVCVYALFLFLTDFKPGIKANKT